MHSNASFFFFFFNSFKRHSGVQLSIAIAKINNAANDRRFVTSPRRHKRLSSTHSIGSSKRLYKCKISYDKRICLLSKVVDALHALKSLLYVSLLYARVCDSFFFSYAYSNEILTFATRYAAQATKFKNERKNRCFLNYYSFVTLKFLFRDLYLSKLADYFSNAFNIQLRRSSYFI